MKHAAILSLLIIGASPLAGCSLGNSLTTGSILGGGGTKAADASAVAAPAAPTSDPTGRAFQVGAVSARAVKCGYNFDPVKLKVNFLAAEAAQGLNPEGISKIDKIYDISRNGIAKAVAGNSSYCSEKKTAQIKEDLTRHLAGDFTPSQRKLEAKQDEGGLFGDFFGDVGEPSDMMGNKQIDAMTK